jgi:hypothetical protein
VLVSRRETVGAANVARAKRAERREVVVTCIVGGLGLERA